VATSVGLRPHSDLAPGSGQRPAPRRTGRTGGVQHPSLPSSAIRYVLSSSLANRLERIVLCRVCRVELKALELKTHPLVPALAYVLFTLPNSIRTIIEDISGESTSERVESLTDVALVEWLDEAGQIPNAAVTRGPTKETRYAVIGRVSATTTAENKAATAAAAAPHDEKSQVSQWKCLAVASYCDIGSSTAPIGDGVVRGFADGRRLTTAELFLMAAWAQKKLARCASVVDSKSTLKHERVYAWEVTVEVEESAAGYDPCSICMETRQSKVVFTGCCDYDGVCARCISKLDKCPICKRKANEMPSLVLGLVKPFPVTAKAAASGSSSAAAAAASSAAAASGTAASAPMIA
jgi:hypothetical protein